MEWSVKKRYMLKAREALIIYMLLGSEDYSVTPILWVSAILLRNPSRILPSRFLDLGSVMVEG